MVPVVLAALMPDVVQTTVVRDAGAIINRLKLCHGLTIRRHRNVAYDVKYRQHRLLCIWLARKRISDRTGRQRNDAKSGLKEGSHEEREMRKNWEIKKRTQLVNPSANENHVLQPVL